MTIEPAARKMFKGIKTEGVVLIYMHMDDQLEICVSHHHRNFFFVFELISNNVTQLVTLFNDSDALEGHDFEDSGFGLNIRKKGLLTI